MWVPPRVGGELLAERRAYEAELAQQVDRMRDLFRVWNGKLRAIDPYLELVQASQDATALGLKPGYFHVLRHNPGAPPDIVVHEGPDGEFREPDSGIFDRLEKGDMWSNRSLGQRRKRELEAQRAKERTRERAEQERLDEMAQRWKAASRPQVLISDVKGWTPKAGVRSG